MLLLAVWWVWIGTSWVTNWLDPERVTVRMMMFALMAAGLVLSAAIPQAFGERGMAFAVAYVAMQVGRSLFMAGALRGRSESNYRNFQRVAVWMAFSGLFWLAGGLLGGSWRLGLWAVGAVIDYLGPTQGFRVPGLGRSTTADWDVEGGHLAERCGLFVIIALGESVLVAGETFSRLAWTGEASAALATVFLGTVALWAVYFNLGAERARRTIVASDDPGALARAAYTYVHLVIVAGIILVAVGGEAVLAHPFGHAEAGTTAVILGGPALYLAGNALFKRESAPRLPLSHLAGIGALALLAPFAARAAAHRPGGSLRGRPRRRGGVGTRLAAPHARRPGEVMHTLQMIAFGLALLALVLWLGRVKGRTGAATGGTRLAALVFLPVWAAVSLANLWVGVSRAGYGLQEEAIVLLAVFGVPAAAALLARRLMG